jgi:K+-sensing histidine kinase KdpD
MINLLRERVGDAIDLKHGWNGRIGVTGRVAVSGQSELISDIDAHPDYIEYAHETRSELAVPMKIHDEVIGVINIEHPEPAAFDQEDQRVLEALAAQAAVAIENARLFEQIRNQLEVIQRTKESLAAHATIAWMGMIDATWRHAIVNNALAIRNNINTLRITLPQQALTPRTEEILAEIKRVAEMIRERPITPPLSREEGAVSVQVNDFLRERLGQIRENERYRLADFQFLHGMDERVTVRISREWMRNVFDILIDNAIDAMRQSAHKRITVTTRLVGPQVEIEVIDTGRGIPEPIRSQLGHEKIPKSQGERGMGMGVLLAQTIIQTYGGKIEIGATGATGTTIVLRLPVELSNGKKPDNV